ncbi:MAG: hypothetical protein HF975_16310 [ANME-2 cluster archaeon]|nr:hypothetical protein [ANME-2 cluster archaeon]MBC2748527.1 hypothetical protein [ANME-2 cluster archaeon]
MREDNYLIFFVALTILALFPATAARQGVRASGWQASLEEQLYINLH